MKKPTARSLLTLLVKMMIPIILVETISWALYTRTPPVGRMNIAYLLGKPTSLVERPHPYLLWENTPNAVSEGFRQFNSTGYRNPRDFGPKQPGVIRILALGGSTTYGCGVPDPNHAWPMQLERMLPNAEVINGGLQFGTSAELLLHYLYRDRYLEPDVVILHVGLNDAVPMLYDNYRPDYSTWRKGWISGLHRLRRGERTFVAHSHFVRFLYACWLSDHLAMPHIDKTPVFMNESESYYFKNAMSNEPTGFQRNTELLLRNIIADNAVPILFAPVIPTESDMARIRHPQTHVYRKRLFKGHRVAIDKILVRMRDLSVKYNVPLLEMLPGQMPGNLFVDRCHLNEEGQRMKAEFLAEAMRQQGILAQQ